MGNDSCAKDRSAQSSLLLENLKKTTWNSGQQVFVNYVAWNPPLGCENIQRSDFPLPVHFTPQKKHDGRVGPDNIATSRTLVPTRICQPC